MNDQLFTHTCGTMYNHQAPPAAPPCHHSRRATSYKIISNMLRGIMLACPYNGFSSSHWPCVADNLACRELAI
ncbi:unnamed protein product, partial [Pylaiella littoralis]